MWRYYAFFGALIPGVIQGAEPAPDESGAAVPHSDDSSSAQQQEQLEPEITIIRRDADRIEEYRIGGQLYMIKVVPAKGFPYYLTDTDGDGRLETRRNDLEPDVLVPRWKILTWD